MATELEHIALANRNHEALRVLLNADDDHPEWIATIAFYKALQILEATFPSKGLGHSHGHARRLEIIQDANNGYLSLCKHYEALLEASEVARYLGSRSCVGGGYTQFADYMSMDDVREKLIKKRLMNVEMHARQFLSDDAKKALKQCNGNRTSQPLLTGGVRCTGSGHPPTFAMEFDDGTFRGCCEAAPVAAAAAAVRSL